MDKFTTAYIECALWSSTDDQDRSLEDSYDLADLAPETVKAMEEDCADFQQAQSDLLVGIDSAQAGHDFWLTRNRHGAGFWDRGLGEIGQALTDAAHVYSWVAV